MPPKPPQYDILGGAGAYSALGARLLSPSPHQSKEVGWIVDRGADFPPNLTSLIKSWETSSLLRTDPSRLTTRGWNGYANNTQYRSFKYTTPKLRLEASDLLDSPALLASKSFHLICSPQRCISLVTNILSLRRTRLSCLPSPPPKPLFIWEPVPDRCIPDELLNTTAALGYVDVCSPNHAELGQLTGCTGELADGSVDRTFVEDATEMLLASMPLSSVAVVVRCGSAGCYIGQNSGRSFKRAPYVPKKRAKSPQKNRKIRGGGLTLSADMDMMSLFAGLSTDSNSDEGDESDEDEVPERDYGLSTWIPAFHTDAARVVDPTGGGNAFLGGLGVAYARGHKLEEAARLGSVAASFAIEQVGMPVLRVDENGRETWNGVDVGERIEEFERRCGGGKESNGAALGEGAAEVTFSMVATRVTQVTK